MRKCFGIMGNISSKLVNAELHDIFNKIQEKTIKHVKKT